MTRNPPRTWFRPKRIGWGWSPASWEGWVLTLLPVLVVAVVATLHRL